MRRCWLWRRRSPPASCCQGGDRHCHPVPLPDRTRVKRIGICDLDPAGVPRVRAQIQGFQSVTSGDERPALLIKSVDGEQTDALGSVGAFEGREGQTCPFIGRIVAAVRDRPPWLTLPRRRRRRKTGHAIPFAGRWMSSRSLRKAPGAVTASHSASRVKG
jgi:hypothetical protein